MFVGCIDIGGTFTDLVLYSRQSDLEIFKSPTTPGEFERGFIDVLGVAAASHGMKLGDFLGKMDMHRPRHHGFHQCADRGQGGARPA